MDLAGGDQAAQHFAHLASCGQRSQEELNLFHAGGDYRLKIDGGKHRNGRDLRRRGAFGDGLLIAMAKKLPLGRLAGCRNRWDDPQLLPEFGDGADNRGFAHFAAEGVLQLRDRRVVGFKQFVGLNRQLRYGPGPGELGVAPPVPIAAQGVDVGQNPGGNDKVGLFSGLSREIQPNRNSIIFKPNQQFLGRSNLARIRGRIAPSTNRLDKRRRNRGSELLPRQKEAQAGLFNPSPGFL